MLLRRQVSAQSALPVQEALETTPTWETLSTELRSQRSGGALGKMTVSYLSSEEGARARSRSGGGRHWPLGRSMVPSRPTSITGSHTTQPGRVAGFGCSAVRCCTVPPRDCPPGHPALDRHGNPVCQMRCACFSHALRRRDGSSRSDAAGRTGDRRLDEVAEMGHSASRNIVTKNLTCDTFPMFEAPCQASAHQGSVVPPFTRRGARHENR